MQFISQTTGYWFLLIFSLSMILITYLFSRVRKWKNKDSFLVAGRKVKWWLGGPSIAASWIWAGALFVSVQMAYQKGLAGIFWFTFPNVLALALFAFWAPQIRKKFVNGYTLPQFIKHKLGCDKVHKIYLIPFFFIQLIAIIFNVFAGGTMISLLTGIPMVQVVPVLAIVALLYTLISGVEASIITDFIQMTLIIGGIAIIVPWAFHAAGGASVVSAGLGGLSGGFRNIFHPGVAFSLGIVSSIGLISSTIADQQYWQRTFAMKDGHIAKSFLFGAVLFALVPIVLSLLGFIGASPSSGVVLPAGVDPSMIGVVTVSSLLPSWATALFVLILLAGLRSTVASAISATSSLWATDVVKSGDDKTVIRKSRYAMIGVTLIGLACVYIIMSITGMGLNHLWLLSISVAASISVPTVLSVYWDRLSAKGVFWGVLIAMIVGMPVFFYANLVDNTIWVVMASLFMIAISTAFCVLMPKKDVVVLRS